MRKIALLLILVVLLLPMASAQEEVACRITDRYNASLSIHIDLSSETKRMYDHDSSGYLDRAEIDEMIHDVAPRLNFTPIMNYYYFFENVSLDGRKPMLSINDIILNYTYPMPVNGTSTYGIITNFTFYLNGTSDHVLRVSLPGAHGHFSIWLPDDVVVLESNLANARSVGGHFEGSFSNSIFIRFREMHYFWMNIYATGLAGIFVVLFVFVAYKLRGGQVKGIKLLVRSVLRNMVALFIILTLLFYILWVIGPPPSVRIGGISSLFVRFNIIKYYHLDRPWYDQYLNWWHLLLTGRIAEGVTWGKNPVDLTYSALVSLSIFILASVFSYVLAIYLAVRERAERNLDVYAAGFLALYSIPTFYAALVILHFFEGIPAVYSILVAPKDAMQEGIRILISSLILAVLTIARPYLISRSLAMREYHEPYVRTLHAIGLEPRKIKKFVRRTTMIPSITDSALNFGWILTAQVFLEVIFKVEGMGYILFRGTLNGNPFEIQIAIIYFAVVMIAASIFADVIIYFLDPRVRK